jgi:hydroxymethylglutaryl-CoA lyase
VNTAANHLPAQVTIVEVGPRDGLQNEDGVIETEAKIELIDRLARTGLQVVEATSFVHPKWVPQLADGADVMAGISPVAGVRYPVLVPNAKGLEAALAAGSREVAIFVAASEGFSKANINRTMAESLEMVAPVVATAKAAGVRVRGYLSTVLGCPFDGPTAVASVVSMTEALLTMGCDEISLGDTIGVGTVGDVHAVLDGLYDAGVPADVLAVHMHDTFGQGLANTLAAFTAGVTVADTSVGGLGGCPYAPGAKGNLATEDLVYALHGSGVRTGVDLAALVDISQWMSTVLGRPPASRTAEAMLSKRTRTPQT